MFAFIVDWVVLFTHFEVSNLFKDDINTWCWWRQNHNFHKSHTSQSKITQKIIRFGKLSFIYEQVGHVSPPHKLNAMYLYVCVFFTLSFSLCVHLCIRLFNFHFRLVCIFICVWWVLFDFGCWKFVYWFLCFSCILTFGQLNAGEQHVLFSWLSLLSIWTIYFDSMDAFMYRLIRFPTRFYSFQQIHFFVNWRNQKQKWCFQKVYNHGELKFCRILALVKILIWIWTLKASNNFYSLLHLQNKPNQDRQWTPCRCTDMLSEEN